MKFNWKMTGDDPNDLIAKVKNGKLRVEQMDEKTFWWCVYVGDDTYDCWLSPIPRPKTLDDAKSQCENKYLEVTAKK